MTGSRCPECDRPRNPDGSAGTGCDCAERAGAALRAERQADIAAAEDFDPLRIRPYVTLEGLRLDEPSGGVPSPAEHAGPPARLPLPPMEADEPAGRGRRAEPPGAAAAGPGVQPRGGPAVVGGQGNASGAEFAPGAGFASGAESWAGAGPGLTPGNGGGPGLTPGDGGGPGAASVAGSSSEPPFGSGPESGAWQEDPAWSEDGAGPAAGGGAALGAAKGFAAGGGGRGADDGPGPAASGSSGSGDTAPLPRVVATPGTDAGTPVWSHGPGPYEAVQDHRSGTHPPAAGPGPLPDAVAMHHEEEAAFYVAGPGAGDAEAERRARRRRAFAGIVVGAAAVAVAGTAALAGGLFAGDDTQDRALPPDTRSSAPSASVEPDAPSGSVSTGVSASASASPSASVSASPSSSPSPSRSAPRTSPSAGDAPAAPSAPPPSTARATGTVSEAPPQNNGGTLRRGDSGPAVTELQQRLRQLWLYPYDEADGRFDEDVEQAVKVYQWDRGIERDPLGVYGPHTRRALEAETRDP